MRGVIGLALLLCGCAPPSVWKYDTIETAHAEFDCAKLIYQDPRSGSPLQFEMTRIGFEIGAYLNLTQYRLTHGSSIRVSVSYDDEAYEEEIPLLQGRMRLRLSQEMTQKLIGALQEGKEVKISADGFEKTLRSESFLPLYQKLVKNSDFLQNLLQGPFK